MLGRWRGRRIILLTVRFYDSLFFRARGHGPVTLSMCCGTIFVLGISFAACSWIWQMRLAWWAMNSWWLGLRMLTCSRQAQHFMHVCPVRKWWQGQHFVTSPCAVAILLWIAFKTCFLVMFECVIYSVFYVFWLLTGCGFPGRDSTLRVFWWLLVSSQKGTFRVVIASRSLCTGHVPSWSDPRSFIVECSAVIAVPNSEGD